MKHIILLFSFWAIAINGMSQSPVARGLHSKEDTLNYIEESIEKALALKEKAQYLNASNEGLKALKLSELIGDSIMIAYSMNSLGNIYKKLGKNTLALNYLLKAYQIRVSVKATQASIAFSLSNIALMYEELMDYGKALSYHIKAYSLKNELELFVVQSVNARGIGKCYWKLGSYQKSFHYLNEAISLNVEDNEYEVDRRNTKTYYILGEVYLSQGNFKQAEQNLNKSLCLVEKHGFKEYYYLNYNALSRLYEQLKRPSQALEYYKKSIVHRDSIINSRNLKIMTELNLRYNLDKTQLENTRLTNAAKEQENSLIQERLVTRGLILGMILATVIIVLVFILLRRNRMQKEEVIQKNIVINTSLGEKEELVQEIHHRVKNNLQIVSSLFALQLKHLENEDAIKVIRDGMNLVMSMSIVHEKLYMDKSKSGVEVQEYVSELIQSIRLSFNRNNLKFELDICKLTLDIESMIYVGMLLNEIVTNIFKYAFPDNKEGQVRIQFEKDENQELLLTVKDNGIGIDTKHTAKSSKTIGFKLIRAFLSKLRGTMKVISNNGTQIDIKITKFSEVG